MKITVKTKDGQGHVFTCKHFRIEGGGLSVFAPDDDLIAYFKDDWAYVIREIA